MTKSPWPTGRVGPFLWQDWVVGCKIALELLEKTDDSAIEVIDNVHIKGEQSDIDLYREALTLLNAPLNKVAFIPEAQETIEQLEVVLKISDYYRSRVIIISTFLHYPRVRWLCRGKGFEHRIAWGIPRPYEAMTDIIMTFLFPLIDLTLGSEWFKERVNARRKSGKL